MPAVAEPILPRSLRTRAFAGLGACLLILMAAGCFKSNTDAPEPPAPEPLPGPVPVITSHPRDTSAIEGGTASFSVTATGATTYIWVKGVNDTLFTATSPTLTLTNIPITDHNATYKCVIGNSEGRITSQFGILSVTAAPVSLVPAIVAQPMNTLLVPGGTATLNVTASGPSLTYQWFRWNQDNAVLNGTSSMLLVSNVSEFADSIPYYCVISNSHGTITTDTVNIRIDAPRSFLLDTGAVLYAQNCAGCHGVSGQGGGLNPRVANADFMLNERTRSIAMVLAGGQTGDTITVNGTRYAAGGMPSFGEILSHVETAAVLTYIRAVLNDSLVTACNPNVLDGAGHPVCQKTARTPQQIASDSISFREVITVRQGLSPL
jgi:mono/diheme cytochrome c family protein